MKADVHSAVRKSLAKKHACYVLITCDKPSADGFMQIDMSYEGDALLASFLLQGAQDRLDEDSDDDGDSELQLMQSQSIAIS